MTAARQPSKRSISGSEHAVALRRARHAVAIYEFLAADAVEQFVTNGEGGPPAYLIGGRGVSELADGDLVHDIARELRQRADAARQEVDSLLAAKVSGVVVAPRSPRMFTEPGVPEEAVSNHSRFMQEFAAGENDEEA